jgi:hypothetical protein
MKSSLEAVIIIHPGEAICLPISNEISHCGFVIHHDTTPETVSISGCQDGD